MYTMIFVAFMRAICGHRLRLSVPKENEDEVGSVRFLREVEQYAKSDVVTWTQLQINLFDDPNPLQVSGEKERLEHTADAIKHTLTTTGKDLNDIDVISFSEAWTYSSAAMKGLRDSLRILGFKYQTGCGQSYETCNTGSLPMNLFSLLKPLQWTLHSGGLMLVSRHEIVESDDMVYQACAGSDCLTAKGVLYVKITKRSPTGKRNNLNAHVFLTHMNANWELVDPEKTLEKQTTELKSFIDGKTISSTEPVMLCGDLNIDAINSNQQQYDDFRNMTKMAPLCGDSITSGCVKIVGDANSTVNPIENPLLGRDGSNAKCKDKYEAALGDQRRLGNSTECSNGTTAYKSLDAGTKCLGKDNFPLENECALDSQCESGCCGNRLLTGNSTGFGRCIKKSIWRRCGTNPVSGHPHYVPNEVYRLSCDFDRSKMCYCPCFGAAKWLDYGSFLTNYLNPEHAVATVLPLRTKESFKMTWHDASWMTVLSNVWRASSGESKKEEQGGVLDGTHISDHDAVWFQFGFDLSVAK